MVTCHQSSESRVDLSGLYLTEAKLHEIKRDWVNCMKLKRTENKVLNLKEQEIKWQKLRTQEM